MTAQSSQTEPTEPSAPGDEPEALRRAEAAFARGDHAALRGLLAELDRSGVQRARGEQLARAVSFDPMLLLVLIACALVLGAVCIHYLMG
jgi:hypothetical protein